MFGERYNNLIEPIRLISLNTGIIMKGFTNYGYRINGEIVEINEGTDLRLDLYGEWQKVQIRGIKNLLKLSNDIKVAYRKIQKSKPKKENNIVSEYKVERLEKSIIRSLKKYGPLKSYELKRKTGAYTLGVQNFDRAIKNLKSEKKVKFSYKLKLYKIKSPINS